MKHNYPLLAYILKRILLFVPTLLLISVLAFALSKIVPKDQVISVLQMRGVKTTETSVGIKEYEKTYKELGRDKANFYFSIKPNHYPRNINAHAFGPQEKLYKQLLKKGYDYLSVEKILAHHTDNEIPLLDLENKIDTGLSQYVNALNLPELNKTSFYFPKFSWHGMDNQYHNWLRSFSNNGFGISITDGKQALGKVTNALKWTLSITLIDLVLSIILGLLLGIYLVKNANKKFAKFLNQFFYLIYSIPVFCLATLFVIYFTTDDYGSFTNIFPSIGVDVYPGKSTFAQIALNASKLILPILCLTLHSLGYTSRFLQKSLRDEMNKDYVSTAYAKGLSTNEIIDKHVLRNALIPFITVFVSAAVAAFGGMLIIEIIFNIPGIGRLLYNSIAVADWNVVFCILMVISFVTVIIYLIGDILYASFNPKIKLNK